MPKHQITKKQFTEAMKEAVRTKGVNYVYQKGQTPRDDVAYADCYYAHGPTKEELEPGCLIGTALMLCGVPLAEMVPYEATSALNVMTRLTTLSGQVQRAASTAQAVQDRGEPWGMALAAYMLEKGDKDG